MHLSTLPACLLLLITLWGCRSQQVDLRPVSIAPHPLLPRLHISFDESSLQASYGVFPGVMVTELPDTLATLGNVALKAVPNDPRLQDARVLFRRQLQEITAVTGEETGSLVGRVVGYQHYWRKGSAPLTGLSLLSFGSLNLLGMPSGMYRTAVDVEVEIYDALHQRIGYYQAVGVDDYATGLFFRGWGDHQRFSHSEAMRKAMRTIAQQIAQDANRLQSALAP